MQTSKKQSYNLLQKPHTSYLQISKNTSIKKSSGTQTEKIVYYQNLQNFHSLNEEFEIDYINALKFLNDCHDSMNKIIKENICGDLKLHTSNFFSIPNIPNYFSVLLLLLNKSDDKKSDVNSFSNKCNNISVKNQNAEVKNQISEIEIHNDNHLEEHYPNNYRYIVESIKNDSKSSAETLQTISGTNTDVSSQKELIDRPYEAKINKNMIQLIENEVKKQLKQYLDKNNTEKVANLQENNDSGHDEINQNNIDTIEVSQNPLLQYVQKEFLEAFTQLTLGKLTHHVKDKTQSKIKKLVDLEDTEVNIADIPPEKLDLLEYSLRKLKKTGNINCGPHLNCKVTCSESKINRQKGSFEHKNKFSNIILSKGPKLEDNLVYKRPRSTSDSPSKVNEMFEKISRESLSFQKPVLLNDTERKKHFYICPETNFDSKQICMEDKIQNINQSGKDNCDFDDDSDSIILDDEEYERKLINFKRQNDISSAQTLWRTDSFTSIQSDGSCKKFHPLQLSEKDLNNVDDKILKTIGIFTTKGIIKPEFIDTIEKKEKLGKTKNQNKQFRTRRRIDFEVSYKPNNNLTRQCGVNVESSISEANFSLKSAVSYSSAESNNDSGPGDNRLLNSKSN